MTHVHYSRNTDDFRDRCRQSDVVVGLQQVERLPSPFSADVAGHDQHKLLVSDPAGSGEDIDIGLEPQAHVGRYLLGSWFLAVHTWLSRLCSLQIFRYRKSLACAIQRTDAIDAAPIAPHLRDVPEALVQIQINDGLAILGA